MTISLRWLWPWDGGRIATVQDARKYLGDECVLGSEQVLPYWGEKAFCAKKVFYPLKVIRWCAKANRKKKARWRLVYIRGLSLHTMLERFGDNPDRSPCFFTSHLWRLGDEDCWTRKSVGSGFYLINFAVWFRNLTDEKQDVMLEKLGYGCERCPEQILVEALFSTFLLNKERLLSEDFHCGPTMDSRGLRVKVGYFDESGIVITSSDFRRKDAGIVTYLRPYSLEAEPEESSEPPPT